VFGRASLLAKRRISFECVVPVKEPDGLNESDANGFAAAGQYAYPAVFASEYVLLFSCLRLE
jgi:hypothetical protein